MDSPCEGEISSEAFSQQRVLKAHLLSPTKQKLYACDTCSKAFSRRQNLKGHLLTHTKEKPYACDVCKKAFSEMSNLKRHSRIHTKEKPFACDICNKSFSVSSGLKRHLLTHTEEKPYACDICSKEFSQLESLKRHLRTHTKEKPFACFICEVICESWGSIYNRQKGPTAIDGDNAAVGTTDKRMFIYSNGAPPGHKSDRKLLKAAIVTMYEPNFHKHFVNSTSPLMLQSLTSKVIDRIANSECMPWL
ncbi:Zinc finger protein 568 [Araneus ventricosus]|uniref:Zinc finger protein 568 n=1 Tax=Araneus ventricosus TaxID=182803 RepID=A0A4Y2HWB8_ARAVE|nr:Zinc finger protein 568 [Araneus ventricosus]